MFEQMRAFIDAHRKCTAEPHYAVRLPRNQSPSATGTVVIACACGVHALITCSRLEAEAFIEARKLQGGAIVVDDANRPHDEQ